jgi:hypothetical protein
MSIAKATIRIRSQRRDALVPGTCYGTGADREAALIASNGERARIRGLAKAAKAAKHAETVSGPAPCQSPSTSSEAVAIDHVAQEAPA